MSRLVLCAIAILGAASASAHADWNSTRWGMSVDEVQAAQGPLDAAPKPDQKRFGDIAYGSALLQADYEAAGIKSKEFYLFQDNVLTGVKLVFSSNVDALKVKRLLDNKYGLDPKEVDETKFKSCHSTKSIYRSQAENNVIRYSYFKCASVKPAEEYTLLYEPIVNPKKGGY